MTKNMIPRFCIQWDFKSGAAEPCSQKVLHQALRDERVKRICSQIAATNDAEVISALKRQLPAFCFHAQSFEGCRRRADRAVPSGLVMLDIDHVCVTPSARTALTRSAACADVDPDIVCTVVQGEREVVLRNSLCYDNAIYLVAVTPSTHGLRIVGERQPGESLPDAQSRLAKALGFSEYDSCTKDLARLSFCVPEEYVLYLNESGLFFADEAEAEQVAAQMSNAAEEPAPQSQEPEEQRGEDGPLVASYKGLPYSEIVSALTGLLGGEPAQGERNVFFFTLVRYMRYITDFREDLLLDILPDFGLSAEERRAAIRSGINRPHKSEIPDIVNRAIATAEVAHSSVEEPENGEEEVLVMPKLPQVLETICSHVPEGFRPALVVGMLPILGTLATKIRFRYLDHQEHSFSFMSCITAPAATGKSFIRIPSHLLLTPIEEQDEIERQREEDYKEALRAARNKKEQPENPKACPRKNAINISIAKLLQRLSYSGGKHLIGIGEEIDTLVKSERAGAWSQKSDIYRLAFDNAEYGQDYMSDNSFSTVVPVYYNLLITGTPQGMYRFFGDVEDGLVTRWCFAALPDMFGQRMPEFVPYSRQDERRVVAVARWLCEQEGELFCPKLDESIARWLEEKRLSAIETDSRAVDTIRRRTAVIGYRAGMLAFLLNKRRWSKSVADFALWVAEYCFRQQMALFGDKFEAVGKEQEACRRTGKVRRLLDKLPEEFSKTDLVKLRATMGQSTRVNMVLHRWIGSGLIEEYEQNRFRILKH